MLPSNETRHPQPFAGTAPWPQRETPAHAQHGHVWSTLPHPQQGHVWGAAAHPQTSHPHNSFHFQEPQGPSPAAAGPRFHRQGVEDIFPRASNSAVHGAVAMRADESTEKQHSVHSMSSGGPSFKHWHHAIADEEHKALGTKSVPHVAQQQPAGSAEGTGEQQAQRSDSFSLSGSREFGQLHVLPGKESLLPATGAMPGVLHPTNGYGISSTGLPISQQEVVSNGQEQFAHNGWAEKSLHGFEQQVYWHKGHAATLPEADWSGSMQHAQAQWGYGQPHSFHGQMNDVQAYLPPGQGRVFFGQDEARGHDHREKLDGQHLLKLLQGLQVGPQESSQMEGAARNVSESHFLNRSNQKQMESFESNAFDHEQIERSILARHGNQELPLGVTSSNQEPQSSFREGFSVGANGHDFPSLLRLQPWTADPLPTSPDTAPRTFSFGRSSGVLVPVAVQEAWSQGAEGTETDRGAAGAAGTAAAAASRRGGAGVGTGDPQRVHDGMFPQQGLHLHSQLTANERNLGMPSSFSSTMLPHLSFLSDLQSSAFGEKILDASLQQAGAGQEVKGMRGSLHEDAAKDLVALLGLTIDPATPSGNVYSTRGNGGSGQELQKGAEEAEVGGLNYGLQPNGTMLVAAENEKPTAPDGTSNSSHNKGHGVELKHVANNVGSDGPAIAYSDKNAGPSHSDLGSNAAGAVPAAPAAAAAAAPSAAPASAAIASGHTASSAAARVMGRGRGEGGRGMGRKGQGRGQGRVVSQQWVPLGSKGGRKEAVEAQGDMRKQLAAPPAAESTQETEEAQHSPTTRQAAVAPPFSLGGEESGQESEPLDPMALDPAILRADVSRFGSTHGIVAGGNAGSFQQQQQGGLRVPGTDLSHHLAEWKIPTKAADLLQAPPHLRIHSLHHVPPFTPAPLSLPHRSPHSLAALESTLLQSQGPAPDLAADSSAMVLRKCLKPETSKTNLPDPSDSTSKLPVAAPPPAQPAWTQMKPFEQKEEQAMQQSTQDPVVQHPPQFPQNSQRHPPNSQLSRASHASPSNHQPFPHNRPPSAASSSASLPPRRQQPLRHDTLRLRGNLQEMNEKLLGIFCLLQPRPEEEDKRHDLMARLMRMTSEVLPGAQLFLYGSSANSFGLTSCDLDVCLKLEGEEVSKVEVISTMADMLKANGMEDVQALTHARVPVAKFRDAATGLSCDVCCNNMAAVANTKLLADYGRIDPRLRQLAFVVKHWAKRRQINEAYKGTLSSYAYILMCIHFLQNRTPPILPCLQAMEATYDVQAGPIRCCYFDRIESLLDFGASNTETLGELLFWFFEYWAFRHDYNRSVISIRTGGFLTKGEKDWTRRVGNDRHLICIEDPFETSHDLGRVVDRHSIQFLKEEFFRAVQIMKHEADPVAWLFEPYVNEEAQQAV